MFRALIILLAFSAASATPATAETRAEKVVESWRKWATARNIAEGQIVVLEKGEVRERGALGGAAGAADLASLAKAITATCLARLVDGGAASWTDPVDRWLPAAKAPLGDVTLGALMIQNGGVAPDDTQGWMPALRGAGAPVYDEVVARIAERPLGPAGFRYNNENYGVLGAVIAAIAGAPYAETCAEPGLAPSPVYGRFAAWGGWAGDLADYGRFHWRAFGGADASARPSSAAFSEEVRYGVGTLWRAFGDGWNYWHFGALCFADGDRFMTHAVLFTDGLGVVSRVEGCPEDDWFASLDGAIVRGAFQ